MRYSLTILLLVTGIGSFSQLPWKCIYSDSAIFLISDTVMKSMVTTSMKEQNIPDKAIQDVTENMKSSLAYKARTRYVIASTDSTFIEADAADDGTLRLNSFDDEEFVLSKGEIYCRTRSGKYDSLCKAPVKTFRSTGRQPKFFNYTCKEYISTDSTYTVWVSEELPAYINPGIRMGRISGAVLFYEFRNPGGIVVRCAISKIVQEGK